MEISITVKTNSQEMLFIVSDIKKKKKKKKKKILLKPSILHAAYFKHLIYLKIPLKLMQFISSTATEKVFSNS